MAESMRRPRCIPAIDYYYLETFVLFVPFVLFVVKTIGYLALNP
jgi:hypothetical protein